MNCVKLQVGLQHDYVFYFQFNHVINFNEELLLGVHFTIIIHYHLEVKVIFIVIIIISKVIIVAFSFKQLLEFLIFKRLNDYL